MLLSTFLGLDEELDSLDVFDSVIDGDSNFFINIKKLKTATTPEFNNSYEKVNARFDEIVTLLDASDNIGDKCYREALKRMNFFEVNGINLGFSKTKIGAAWGPGIKKQVLTDAFHIVKKGSKKPELFQLIGLFEENIGPDRISDMISSIIYEDIRNYTRRINNDLDINSDTYSELTFSNGIILNPYKDNCEILYLPIELLHELPVAKDWSDVDDVIRKNEAIRREINNVIGERWGEYFKKQKKRYLYEQVFLFPEKCGRVIDAYNSASETDYNIFCDADYCYEYSEKGIKRFAQHYDFSYDKTDSFTIAYTVLNFFKEWVEYHKGWDVFQLLSTQKKEKLVQRLIHLCAEPVCKSNNIDLSFEADEGRGQLDVKFSRGLDKTIVEVKMSSNNQYIHGYEKQIEEYAKAENTNQRIYLIVDDGHPEKMKKLRELYQKNVDNGKDCPLLFEIDATKKLSASVC